MAAMQKNTLKYSAIVFLGGASYGVMAATVKSAFVEGFSWTQTAASQAFFGALLFSVALVALAVFGKRPVPLSPKRILALLGLGLTTCTTCVLYNFSLTMLPVSVAITMLFQFTWIGTIFQVIAMRHRRIGTHPVRPLDALQIVSIVGIMLGVAVSQLPNLARERSLPSGIDER